LRLRKTIANRRGRELQRRRFRALEIKSTPTTSRDSRVAASCRALESGRRRVDWLGTQASSERVASRQPIARNERGPLLLLSLANRPDGLIFFFFFAAFLGKKGFTVCHLNVPHARCGTRCASRCPGLAEWAVPIGRPASQGSFLVQPQGICSCSCCDCGSCSCCGYGFCYGCGYSSSSSCGCGCGCGCCCCCLATRCGCCCLHRSNHHSRTTSDHVAVVAVAGHSAAAAGAGAAGAAGAAPPVGLAEGSSTDAAVATQQDVAANWVAAAAAAAEPDGAGAAMGSAAAAAVTRGGRTAGRRPKCSRTSPLL